MHRDISSLARPSTQRAAQSKGAYNQAARREEGPGGRGWNAGVIAVGKERLREREREGGGREDGGEREEEGRRVGGRERDKSQEVAGVNYSKAVLFCFQIKWNSEIT